MINYIIQVLIFQILFLAVYDLFLKKETFFQWNRLYLILSSVLAYIIPFIKINSIGNYVQEEFILPEVFINPEMIFPNKQTSFFTLENFYFLGLAIMTIIFLFKIIQIIKKIDYRLVILKKENSAFSFFNYIFLGKMVYQKDHQHILKHELTHVKQRHSLDLLFFEIQKIVFWFNPFSYVYQNRVSTLHEYIADEKTIKIEDKTSFFENLLNQTFNVEKITFVNNYYKQSLLKKRIIMATKNKSKQILKMKYLLILPLLLTMLVYTSCSAQVIKKTANNEVKPPPPPPSPKKVIDKIAPPPPPPPPSKQIVNKDFVSFASIDKTPVFPGCETFTKHEELQKCFNKSVSNHIAKHFNSKLVNSLGLKVGKKKVVSQFIIDKNGDIKDVLIKEIEHNKITNKVTKLDIHPKIEKEVRRIINSLPQMKAGEHGGKKVNVRYNLPIIFMIDGEKKDKN